MKFKIRLTLFLSCLAILGISQRTITGTITDTEGETLIGVNILIQGTNRGTSSDINGSYKIEVTGATIALEFSYTGYSTVVEVVGDRSTLNISMSAGATVLNEMVVIGYGTQRKGAITGAVSELKSDKLEQNPVASFEGSLQGNIAGLQATGTDGSPGGNTQIRIRGIGSITASSEPLYVIDGILVQSGDISGLNGNGGRSTNVMAAINPNDIESVTVLKDASSMAIYGSRGANGVILITTKSGKTGKAKIELKTQVGINKIASGKLLKPLNREQYTQLFLEGYTNDGDTPAEAQANFDNRFSQLTDPSTGQPTDTDWLDEITQTGFNQSYDLSASGGTDVVKYFFSASYFDQESHIIGSDFDRLSSRMNLEVKANDHITISNRLSVASTNQNGFVDGSAWANPLYNAFLLSPLIPVKDATGLFNSEHKNYFPMGGNNPVGALSGDDLRETTQLRFMDNFSVSVNFLEDFTFKSQWNIDFIQIDESQYKNRRYGDGRNSGGYVQEYTTLDKNWLGTQSLSWNKTIDNTHNFGVFAAYEAQKATRKTNYGYGEEFPNDKLKTLASAASAYEASATRSEFTFASVFSKVNYSYQGKYYIDATYRRDGSSRFGSDKRWGDFYSVGLAWSIGDESFIQDLDFIDYMKLRTSYGVTGNAAIGNFPSRGLYGYGRDYDGSPGGEPAQIANPELTWETQKNFNIGLDFNVFKRINGTVEYFNRVSSDLILDVPISLTTGFGVLTQNFAKMENNGLELSLNVGIIDSKDFTLDVGFNTTFLKNKLTTLNESFTDGTKRREEGLDYQSFYLYGWAGIDQTNGDPLWYTNDSETTTTNDIDDAERYLIGKSATPDSYGGFNLNMTYKGFSLSSQFSFSAGNWLYEPNLRFIHGDGRLTPRSTSSWAFDNRWVPGKTDALLPQHIWGDTKGGQNRDNSRYLYDGTFARLRNVTVSYNLPEEIISRAKLSSVRVYVRGTNLWTWTKDKDLFIDPEQAINGIANSLTPAIKSFTFGLDFGF
jgi:TonB-linked SusC/RagA family outer membrane protein